MSGVLVNNAVGAKLQVNIAGSSYVDIPYVGNVTYSDRVTPTDDVVAFEGVGQLSGQDRIGRISIGVASLVPNLQVWKDLAAGVKGGAEYKYRFISKEREVRRVSTDRVNLFSSGIFVLAAVAGGKAPNLLDNDYAVGMFLAVTVAGKEEKYTIESISNASVGTALPRRSAWITLASGSNIRLGVPSMRLGPFKAKVVSIGGFSAPWDGAASGRLELRPTSPIPDWAVA